MRPALGGEARSYATGKVLSKPAAGSCMPKDFASMVGFRNRTPTILSTFERVLFTLNTMMKQRLLSRTENHRQCCCRDSTFHRIIPNFMAQASALLKIGLSATPL